MRSKVTTSDKSIDNAGIPSDYRLAIAEYIWNSFDAKASNVDIQDIFPILSYQIMERV